MLYGLSQNQSVLFGEIDALPIEIGFKPELSNPCVDILKKEGSNIAVSNRLEEIKFKARYDTILINSNGI